MVRTTLILALLMLPGCLTGAAWKDATESSIRDPVFCGTATMDGEKQLVIRYSHRDERSYYAVPAAGPLVYRGRALTTNKITTDLSQAQRSAVRDVGRSGLRKIDPTTVHWKDDGLVSNGASVPIPQLDAEALGMTSPPVTPHYSGDGCFDAPRALPPNTEAAVLVPTTQRRPAGDQARDIGFALFSTPVWLAVDVFIVLPWWAIETFERR